MGAQRRSAGRSDGLHGSEERRLAIGPGRLDVRLAAVRGRGRGPLGGDHPRAARARLAEVLSLHVHYPTADPVAAVRRDLDHLRGLLG